MKKTFFAPMIASLILVGCGGPDTENKAADSTTIITIDTATQYNNLLSTDSSHLLMDEEQFWQIIEQSLQAANGNYQQQIGKLLDLLLEMNPADIEKFDNSFSALLAKSYTSQLWGASYVINGGCSDDCFEYFRTYLIAHGKQKFYATLNDPESCASWIKTEAEDNWEGIKGSAAVAYKQKTGKDLNTGYTPEYKLKGAPFDEETLNSKYPKLAEKFATDMPLR